MIFCGHEVPLSSTDREQIRDHLSSYGKSGSIGIPFLLFSLIDQGQLMVLSGHQPRRFHQHTLDVLVALSAEQLDYPSDPREAVAV